MTLQFFHNQTTVTATEQTFNNRAYLVAPVSMLAVGVLNDVYVPAEEASKFPEAWNGRPATLNHPQRNGQYVSANTPEIAAWETPGQVWATVFQNNKLQAEIWIDTEKAESIGGDAVTVMERLRKGEAVEVSTGYFAEVEATTGTYNGKKYTGIARNIRPDHLALLPNGVGACNWQDGCGTPRVNGLQNNCSGCKKGQAMPKEQKAPTGNEKELGDRYALIRRALRAHTGNDEYDDFDSVSVYDEYVIAKSWQTKEAMAYPYTMAEDGAVSFGEPLPVEVVYRSKADGAELVTANQKAQRVAEQSFVSAVVNGLLTAAGRGKQTTANAGKDSEMEKDVEVQAPEVPVVNEGQPEAKPEKASGDNAVLVNLAALVEGLSKKVDALDAKLTANADKERQALVQALAANERCPFDEAELQALPVAHLQKLATAYQPADYSGAVGVVANRGEQYESLAMPAWVVADGKEE